MTVTSVAAYPGAGDDVHEVDAVRRLTADMAGTSAAAYIDGEEIQQHWRAEYIVWSLITAAFGAFAAFTTTSYMKQVGNSKWYWIMLVQAGLALGVCTIWCMHFFSMQALVLKGGVESGATAEVPVTFEPALTAASALAAWFIATVALHIALGRERDNKRTRKHSDRFRTMRTRMEDSESSTLSRKSSSSFHSTLSKLKTKTFKSITLAAMLVAVGVCAVHYMGMLSQSGHFAMRYDPGIIAANAVIAAVAAWVGLAVFFYIFSSIHKRAIAAVVVSLAVNGMHYGGMHLMGMQSARYFVSKDGGLFDTSTVTWSVGAVDVVVVVLTLNFFLMAATGYYVEVLQSEAFEKEMRHKGYMQETKQLITRSRIMRFPMCLIRYETFMQQGKLVPHEVMRDAKRLVYFNSSAAVMKGRKERFIVFFSHQWLSAKFPDPTGRQFQDMSAALAELIKAYRVKTENMYIWVDYSSIPQECLDQQQLAIDSITTYVSVASAFVIVAPQVLHTEHGTPCNFMTYSKRCWCRLEVFCSLLSTLRYQPAGSSVAILEEEDDGAVQRLLGTKGVSGQGAAKSCDKGLFKEATQQREQHRVFLIVDKQLHRLSFFDDDGALIKEYEELLYVFSGDLECCRRGHVTPEGREMMCDKLKLVPSLVGCYGAMLEDLRRSQWNRKGSVGTDSRWALAELIVRNRREIFPREYFDSRIDAMHTEVERIAANLKLQTRSSSWIRKEASDDSTDPEYQLLDVDLEQEAIDDINVNRSDSEDMGPVFTFTTSSESGVDSYRLSMMALGG